MSLPDTLRRLGQYARYRDKRMVGELLGMLDRHGQSADAEVAIARMPSSDRDFVRAYVASLTELDTGALGFDINALPMSSGTARADTPIAGVDRDASALKYLPSSSGQWTTFMTAAGLATGNPSNLWMCTEPSATNLADSIGAVTLTANNSPTGQNTVSGWTKKAVGTTDGAAMSYQAAAGVNLATTSGLLLGYVAATATPAAERPLIGIGAGTDHRYAAVTTTPRIKAAALGGGTATGTAAPGTTVHPIAVAVNRAATTYKVYTDQEIITVAWTNPGAGGSLVGAGDTPGVGAAPMFLLYLTLFASTAAELSDAQVRTLLTTLGWSCAW